MDKRMRNLLAMAFMGSGKAYRKLGICFLQGRLCKRDRKLAGLCLQKAMEMGDESGYFLYHMMFSKGKKVIDNASYEKMCIDFHKAKDLKEKMRLFSYLRLGTRRQKKSYYYK